MKAPFPAHSDPLGDALRFLRMSGIFYARSEFTAPWGLALPPFEGCMMFHIVTSGQCWIEVKNAEPRPLPQDHMALVPRGDGHSLTHEPGYPTAKLFDLRRELVSERYEFIRHGGGGSPTGIVCAIVQFDHPLARHVIRLLPEILIVDASRLPEPDWIHSTLRFMTAEATALRPGSETVITRLADILIIQTIRRWLEQDPAAQAGWLGALQDKQIGRTLSLIHREPSRSWTVASLASEAAMSRSAFAARFTALVGEPVMQYVARSRMHRALDSLQEGSARISELSIQLGYQSEAAFSRAFKRFNGFSPGAARRKAEFLSASASMAQSSVSVPNL